MIESGLSSLLLTETESFLNGIFEVEETVGKRFLRHPLTKCRLFKNLQECANPLVDRLKSSNTRKETTARKVTDISYDFIQIFDCGLGTERPEHVLWLHRKLRAD